jgi:hypothetical protein
MRPLLDLLNQVLPVLHLVQEMAKATFTGKCQNDPRIKQDSGILGIDYGHSWTVVVPLLLFEKPTQAHLLGPLFQNLIPFWLG